MLRKMQQRRKEKARSKDNLLAVFFVLTLMVALAMPLNVCAGNVTSGTLGDNGGIQWTYDEDTKTLTVTGEDSGLEHEFYSICPAVEKIVVKDCTLHGSAEGAFSGLSFLKEISFENFDTSNVTSMQSMFFYCESLTELNVSSFDTGNVTDMSHMFSSCTSLTSLDLDNFDTGNVTDMSGMFWCCSSLTNLDVSNFDTGSLADMNSMFSGCSSLTNLNISNLDTSNVTNLSGIFTGCNSLTTLDLSNLDTSNMTDMSNMFSFCQNLVSLDLSNFDTSSVVNMYGMFWGCEALTNLDISNFDTSNVTNMEHMFFMCKNLVNLNLSNFDTSNVSNMYGMFRECNGLTALDLSNFDTGKVIDMSLMFRECTNLSELDVSSFDTNGVAEMTGMFAGCISLIDLSVSGFNTNNVISMASMFEGCGSLVTLDVRNFDTYNVMNMDYMFANCNNLGELDVSNFDTSNVTDMGYMFADCNNLGELDVSSFDTSNVTDMGYMFAHCYNLEKVDVSNFDTSKVTEMRNMFYNCRGLTALDLSGFNTSNVAYMYKIFSKCSNLVTLDICNFDTSKASLDGMFSDCNSLRIIRTPSAMASYQSVTLPKQFVNGTGNLTAVLTAEFCNMTLISESFITISHYRLWDESAEAEGKYAYEIVFEIEGPVSEAIVTLEMDEELALLTGDSTSYSIEDLSAGESKIVTWSVCADWPEENVLTTYSVDVWVNNQFNIRQKEGIYLLTKNQNSNEFLLGKDQWSIKNAYDYFGPENEDYYITDEDFNALISNLSNTEVEEMKAYKNFNWIGSCYGMAATAILTKMGVIESEMIQENKGSLYDISKVNNDSVESFINFYLLQQRCQASISHRNSFAALSVTEQLLKIEEMVSEVLVGGCPVLICFGGEDWGHAVVGYGIEHATGNGYAVGGGILGLGATYYDSRVLMYDCNSPEEIVYLYYNSGTDEWCITKYQDATGLKMACNDLSIIDAVNYETTTENYISRINFLSGVQEYNLKCNGETYLINGKTEQRENGIVTFHDANLLADGTYAPSPLIATLPDKNCTYSVEPINDDAGEITLFYENYSLFLNYDSVDSIDFKAGGMIGADGATGAYEMSMVANEGYYSLPWYKVSVIGNDAGSIGLEQTTEGVVISGTNLQDVTVLVSNDVEEKHIEFSTEKESVLLSSKLTKDGEEPSILIDSDDDGKYDEELDDSCDGGESCPSIGFEDVEQSEWYHEAIDYVVENGVMAGVSDNRFDVHGTTTRAMSVTILYNLEGRPEISEENPFMDVESGAWYEKAIVWAASNGIVAGYGNGSFGPNDIITREQMAVILHSYAKYKGYDVSACADISSFSDADQVSEWARIAISWANAEGMINGYGNGKLGPKDDTERCQAASILMKFCKEVAR